MSDLSGFYYSCILDEILLFTEFDSHFRLQGAPSETSALPKFGRKTIEVCITIDFAPEKNSWKKTKS